MNPSREWLVLFGLCILLLRFFLLTTEAASLFFPFNRVANTCLLPASQRSNKNPLIKKIQAFPF